MEWRFCGRACVFRASQVPHGAPEISTRHATRRELSVNRSLGKEFTNRALAIVFATWSSGVAVDGADQSNSTVRKVIAVDLVTTLAETTGMVGDADETSAAGSKLFAAVNAQASKTLSLSVPETLSPHARMRLTVDDARAHVAQVKDWSRTALVRSSATSTIERVGAISRIEVTHG